MPRRTSLPSRRSSALSHIAPDGRARMVDVGAKPVTPRTATAEGFVTVSPALARAIRTSSLTKGSLMDVARLAGVMAAKRTDEIIPLCHALPLDAVHVDAALERAGPGWRVRVWAEARTQSRTGVEMEALTAVAAACLTVIDMGKAVDRGMVIDGIRVLTKSGGRSGVYAAPRRPKGRRA